MGLLDVLQQRSEQRRADEERVAEFRRNRAQQKRARADREAATNAFVQANPDLRSAIGFDPNSAQSQGLLGGLASSDPAARQVAGAAAGALTGERDRQFGLQQQQLQTQNLQEANRQQRFENELKIIKAGNESANELRDEVREIASPMVELSIAGADLNRVLDTGTAIGTRVAVTKLAKLMDPTTGVRGSEAENVASGVGLSEFLLTTYNSLEGEGMSVDGVRDFRQVVDKLMAERARITMGQLNAFREEASFAGLPEQRIDLIFQQSGVNLAGLTEMVIRGMTPEELKQRADELDQIGNGGQ